MAQPRHVDQRDAQAPIAEVVGHRHGVALAALHAARPDRRGAAGLRPQLRGSLGIAGRHHGIGIALDHQQGWPWRLSGGGQRHSRRLRAASLHGAQGREGRVGRAGRDARVHDHHLEESGMPGDHQRRHARPGGEPRHRHARRIHRLGQADLLDRAGDQVGLALRPPAVGIEPVPASLPVGCGALLRVEHQKTFPQRHPVHARAGGKAGGILTAAMQHDQQGQAFVRTDARRPVHPVTPDAGGPHHLTTEPLTRRRRWPPRRDRGRAGGLRRAGSRTDTGACHATGHRHQAAREAAGQGAHAQAFAHGPIVGKHAAATVCWPTDAGPPLGLR